MWTSEQQYAIDVRDKNILVSAAAGSGKTAILVERILGLVKKGEIRMDKLLIATFTTAAAGEIRERILKTLTEFLNENPEYGFIAEQIALFDRASIGTIHSFCQSLLRNNFYRTPLPADFKIADTADLELLKEEVLDEVIEEEYEKGSEEFLTFAEGYSRGKDDSGLRQLIKDLHNYSMAVSDPIEWLESCKEKYDLKGADPDEFLTNGWGKQFIDTTPDILSGYIATYDYLIDLVASYDGYEKYVDFLQEEKQMLTNAYNKALEGGWNNTKEAMDEIAFGRLPSRSKGSDETAKDMVSVHRDKLKKMIGKLKTDAFSADAETLCAYIKVAGVFVATLCDLVIAFERAYSQAKLKKGWVDFSDLEHYTIGLLREHGHELCANYDALMIDEFQDTNEAQAEIFKRLSNGKNLFVVGDIKQSIYRFRNAQPQLFARMDRDYAENHNNGETIYLAKNFRSSGAVVDFTNCVFKRIMNMQVGEVDYGEKESLVRGGKSENNGYVEINIISRDGDSLYEETGNEHLADNTTREAVMVARRIYDLVENEKSLIYDKAIDGMRPVQYKDIAILSRKSKGVATVYAEELALLGIPVYTEESGSYFSTIEITFVMSLLKIIDNPLQDVEFIAVLRSPVFGFDDDDLVQLKSIDKNAGVYELLKRSDQPKAIAALERIDRYIEMAEFSSPADILNYILDDTDYESIVATMPNSNVRLMNIQLLRERAASHNSDGYSSLGDFLSYVMTKSRLGEEYKTASESSLNENTVRIMNIHKSKGLEFPVVFLVGTGTQFNKRDSYAPVLYDIDMGIGLDIIDCNRRLKYPHISKQSIAQKKLIDGLSEEMRIIYVALTRAVSNLYIYGSIRKAKANMDEWSTPVFNKETGKILPYVISSQNCPLGWLVIGNEGYGSAEINYYTAGMVIEECTKPLDIINEQKRKRSAKADEEIIKLMDERFSYKYPYADAVSLPSKLSVSELLDSREHKAELAQADFSKETAGALSGAQRGNIIHFILQNIDLENTDSLASVTEQINNMAERGQITPEALKVADSQLIYRFFSSAEGIRMKKAFEIHREYQFVAEFDAKELTDTTADEKILLQGVIDCWFEEDGQVVIYDYKTGNVDIHSNRYKAQLDLYKKSLERILGKEVKECVICELD